MKPEEILKEFETVGLLVRSVQAHRPELFPVDAPNFKVKTLNGVARQCYSLIHPSIPKPLYQMSPVDKDGRAMDPRTLELADVANNRGFALLLSWQRTWGSVVDAVVADASSGGTFSANETMPTSKDKVVKMIKEFIPKAAKADGDANNEVRTIAVDNSALVGFVFAPSKPSVLNKCKPTWKETAELVKTYAATIRARAEKTNKVTESEFPVFTYSLTKESMALKYIDTVTP